MKPDHLAKAVRLMLCGFLFAFGLPALAVEQGVAAPEFDVAGQTTNVKLNTYHGKLVYLDFWASWCGPCKKSFPWMNDMQKRYGAQGLQVVAVNLDAKRTDALEFLSIVPVSFTIGFDPAGAVARSYGVKGMPSSVLIAPDGSVIAMHEGFNDGDKGDLENRIRGNLKLAK